MAYYKLFKRKQRRKGEKLNQQLKRGKEERKEKVPKKKDGFSTLRKAGCTRSNNCVVKVQRSQVPLSWLL
jgi:hypothetical protein